MDGPATELDVGPAPTNHVLGISACGWIPELGGSA